VIVDGDLCPGRGQVQHRARARGESAIERDPSGLVDRLRASRFLVIAIACCPDLAPAFATRTGFRKRCNLLQNRGFGRSSTCQSAAQAIRNTACPAGQRHYTFAPWPNRIVWVQPGTPSAQT